MQFRRFGLAALAGVLAALPAAAATCGGSFPAWLDAFKKGAAAEGISPRTIASALDGVSLDQGTLNRDRGQAVFSQSFLDFSAKLIPASRLQRGEAMLAQHRATLAEVERRFGVPGPVLVAFWGLETDYGGFMGKLPILPSLATLAYDCRRGEEFRPRLLDALRIVERGDLRPSEMIGSWAGELGQTQFLPTVYLSHAIDFDGDGRRDLIRSVPDVLASTANYIADLGWQRGQPWLQEVRVPAELPWDQADLSIRHPSRQWAQWGVTLADGAALRSDAPPSSLLLPMGRRGPAFLAYPNFTSVYLEWNNSLVYSTTAAYFATRLAGAPPVSKGRGAESTLSVAQIQEMQRLLAKEGYDVGKVDGIAGAGTRAAVKAMQMKLGLPADSYPSAELLERLRGARS